MLITVITPRNNTVRIVAKRKERQTVIRFVPGVLEKLDKVAAKQGRSRNTEVNLRLIESLGMKKAVSKESTTT
jgi:hypothetical protein